MTYVVHPDTSRGALAASDAHDPLMTIPFEPRWRVLRGGQVSSPEAEDADS